MHLSPIPIREWFWAASRVAADIPGISAAQFQRQLSLGSDTTAWHILHQLRTGMVNKPRSHPSGMIETDKSTIGGQVKQNRGRGVTAAKHKSLVIGAVEVIAYENK